MQKRTLPPAVREFGSADSRSITPREKRALEYWADCCAANVVFSLVDNPVGLYSEEHLGNKQGRVEAWAFALGILFRLFDDASVLICDYESEVDADHPHPIMRHLLLSSHILEFWRRQGIEVDPTFLTTWASTNQHLDSVWKNLSIPGSTIRNVLQQPEWLYQTELLLDDAKRVRTELGEFL